MLERFENQAGLQTNFVLRNRYHAGNEQDKSDTSPEKLAFVNNILDSDYTVCVRGGGNFSVRFYETLALGRIPIFIDTDCLLPFEDMIDYKGLFPWISQSELPQAAEILLDYHQSLSNDQFVERQLACRELWERHFTVNGFHNDFITRIKQFC